MNKLTKIVSILLVTTMMLSACSTSGGDELFESIEETVEITEVTPQTTEETRLIYTTDFEYPILSLSESSSQEIASETFYSGNTIEFGTYKGQELVWDVVYTEDNQALLFLSDVLRDEEGNADRMPYNVEFVPITWEECSLRAWLNGEFYNNVFGVDNSAILMITNTNVDHEEHYDFENLDTGFEEYTDYYSYGGNDTDDYIFLISEQDINDYFTDLEVLSGIREDFFIRDMYVNNMSAGTISISGYYGIIESRNIFVPCGIRPAMWIDISYFSEG